MLLGAWRNARSLRAYCNLPGLDAQGHFARLALQGICLQSQGNCGDPCDFIATLKLECSDGTMGIITAQPSYSDAYSGSWVASEKKLLGGFAAGRAFVAASRQQWMQRPSVTPAVHLALVIWLKAAERRAAPHQATATSNVDGARSAAGFPSVRLNVGEFWDDITLTGGFVACSQGSLLAGISAVAHGYPTGSLSNVQLLCSSAGGGEGLWCSAALCLYQAAPAAPWIPALTATASQGACSTTARAAASGRWPRSTGAWLVARRRRGLLRGGGPANQRAQHPPPVPG
jgi:hypothetical protein